jgi:hypothetical protein
MKTSLLATLGVLLTGTLLAADASPKDAVKAAARALAEKANYTWVSTPKNEGGGGGGGGGGNFRAGPTTGKIEKDGFALVTSSMGDNTVESAFKGAKGVVKIEGEWKGPDDLDDNQRMFANRLRNFKAPAAQAEELAGKVKELKAGADGQYTGDLTEDGAKELLSLRRRPDAPAPKEAKGSVKFWVKDGVLVKWETNVQGKVTGRDDQEISVNRTTTVEVKEVGSTKVSVPEEARKKLS